MVRFIFRLMTAGLVLGSFCYGQFPAVSNDPAQVYASGISAAVKANDPKAVASGSRSMLQGVPYDSLVDETFRSAIHFLQTAYTAEALRLYAEREPILLTMIREGGRDASSSIALQRLYADGVAFAALQQFAGKPEEARNTIAELDAALPKQLERGDLEAVETSRRQYALLGAPLPRIPLALSLFAAGETPRINTNYGNATALLLFPETCAHCIRMAQDFRAVLYRVSRNDVHLYGLVAQANPSVAAPPSTGKAKSLVEPASSRDAAEELRGTPTLVVPLGTLKQFAASEFPLLIVLDSQGVIRFIQPAPEDALEPGALLDQVTSQVAERWPRPVP